MAVVSATIGIRQRAGQETIEVRANFCYTASDPYAVLVTFEVFGGSVIWTFARDLLTTGLAVGSAGVGDVVIDLDPLKPSTIILTLRSGSGRATFDIPANPLRAFLAQTYDLVPTGSERIDVDAEVAGW